MVWELGSVPDRWVGYADITLHMFGRCQTESVAGCGIPGWQGIPTRAGLSFFDINYI